MNNVLCVPGCQALEGFLQSGDQFVTLRHCGCVMDGEYYKVSSRLMHKPLLCLLRIFLYVYGFLFFVLPLVL